MGALRPLCFMLIFALSWETQAQLPAKLESPSLIVYKSKRQMSLYSGGKLVKVYPIGLGADPASPKRRQGDRATPEGEYRICGKHPGSIYFRALILNYPNRDDADRGLSDGLISRKQHAAIVAANDKERCPDFFTRLGGQIEIHGMGAQSDWTWGCVALDNTDIAELYKALPNGTPVTIKP